VHEQPPPERGQLADVVEELGRAEALLRREWALNHGCDPIALYGDDGELSCAGCITDFRRMAIGDLRSRVTGLRLQRISREYEAGRLDGALGRPPTAAVGPGPEFRALECGGCKPLREFAERVVKVADTVAERIAECGSPPPWWSGTQLDASRLRKFALEALGRPE
jgi:hypothetical protein